jgi:hypothetical protein
MTKMTEKKLARMIFSWIGTSDKCLVSDRILAEVFGQPDRFDALKPLVDPFQEKLAAFCTRHELVILPGKDRGRTVFTVRS